MLSDIGHFSGSDNFYRHWLGIIYTDGVEYVAREGKAYWLIDAIASYYEDTKQHEFQHWTLKRKEKNGWNLKGTDGNDNIIASQDIEYSDFPLSKIEFFLSNGTLMLPNEY